MEYKDENNVKCCICQTIIDKKNAFIPRKCLIKNGEKTSHRICSHCWWQSFALENASHDCPGCVKGFPLTEYKKTTPIVVDLTGDF